MKMVSNRNKSATYIHETTVQAIWEGRTGNSGEIMS